MKPLLALLLLASTTLAAEPQVHRDIAYVEPKNERQTLDVFAPATGTNHPVIVWIHGGGWTRGDKAGVQQKPQAFTDKGYVFVPVNYRFVPNVGVKDMAGDIAQAIRWVYDHAKEFGGDPNSIFVMGHSAGAHLAALVCTDGRYLGAAGLSLAFVKGCVPIDVSVYDIPKRLKDGGSVNPETFKAVFGEAEELQKLLSPATHVGKAKNIPSFLILHVADRPDTKAQSQWFADKLQEAGVSAKVVAAEGKNHGTINSDLGKADDKPTHELYDFLDEVLKKYPSPKVVAYTEPVTERQTLDVYAPASGKNHPIVFWIHGGGWQQGAKNDVQVKPRVFMDRGFVFVSTNYRLVPHVTIKQMAGDLAKAIRWTHDHAEEIGGDPNTIFVMGHSAGAQLAALLCTDDSYVKAEGLSPSIIKGCVPVDGDTYDVPLRIATTEQRIADIYRSKFGNPEQQKDLSPVTHVTPGKKFPPFLILYVAGQPPVTQQSQRLEKALQEAGATAHAFPSEGKTHSSLNADLGLQDDKPTKAMFDLLDGILKK